MEWRALIETTQSNAKPATKATAPTRLMEIAFPFLNILEREEPVIPTKDQANA
mgnify:CR=1 FL=1